MEVVKMIYNTKADYIDALKTLIEPVRDALRAGEGTPSFGSSAAWYNDISASVEAFARPLWGLVPLWRGGYGGNEMKTVYVQGIINGTDPKSKHYWGLCGHCDQRYVEMASMAYALLFTPQIVWEPLDPIQRERLVVWLWQINTHEVCDSNWRFFRVLVNIALKHLKKRYSRDKLAEDLARIDDFYLGNGWYMDGPQHQKDYYISMAIHFYSLIYSCFEEDEYAKKYRERAVLFGKEFIYWFADNGAALPYGRSLTYRFAQGAFWSACLLAGVKPFSDGVIKGILSRHLDDWMKAPITDNAGMLSIGYKYQNLLMAEHYNAPGSPYWGLKFFAMLALKDNDAFWRAKPEPLPRLADKHLMREADMIVTRKDGEVYAYPAGTHNNLGCGHITSKYLKFVYSTKFGFNVKFGDNSINECCSDNMLVFNIGGVFCERRANYSFELNEDRLVINWSPIKGIRVKTELIPDGSDHIRKHRIESEFDCIAYEGGFAVASRDKDQCECRAEGAAAIARNSFSGCKIVSEGGKAEIVSASPNTNLVYPKTVIPSVKHTVCRGITWITTKVTVL